MKTAVTHLLALAILAALPAVAQAQYDQDDMVAKRDAKLAKAFFTKADWTTDYDAARATAKAEDKLIFAYFSRSHVP